MLLAWLCAAAVASAATLLGPDPLLSALRRLAALGWTCFAALIFGAFVVGAVIGRDGIKYIAGAAAAGLTVVVAIALLQLAGALSRNADRIDATLGNAGFLGAYLCLVIPIGSVSRAAAPGGCRP